MKRTTCLLLVPLLHACAVVPAGTAVQACQLLSIAAREADMAPAWYVATGDVLAQCGEADAPAQAEARAQQAEARQ